MATMRERVVLLSKGQPQICKDRVDSWGERNKAQQSFQLCVLVVMGQTNDPQNWTLNTLMAPSQSGDLGEVAMMANL